jgi:hypothetical protein
MGGGRTCRGRQPGRLRYGCTPSAGLLCRPASPTGGEALQPPPPALLRWSWPLDGQGRGKNGGARLSCPTDLTSRSLQGPPPKGEPGLDSCLRRKDTRGQTQRSLDSRLRGNDTGPPHPAWPLARPASPAVGRGVLVPSPGFALPASPAVGRGERPGFLLAQEGHEGIGPKGKRRRPPSAAREQATGVSSLPLSQRDRRDAW